MPLWKKEWKNLAYGFNDNSVLLIILTHLHCVPQDVTAGYWITPVELPISDLHVKIPHNQFSMGVINLPPEGFSIYFAYYFSSTFWWKFNFTRSSWNATLPIHLPGSYTKETIEILTKSQGTNNEIECDEYKKQYLQRPSLPSCPNKTLNTLFYRSA